MGFLRQPVATRDNGLGSFERSRGRTICHRLRPVATAGLFLKKGGLSSCRCWFTSPFLLPDGCSSLSWRLVAHRVGGSCLGVSFHKGPSGGQSQAGACRDRGG